MDVIERTVRNQLDRSSFEGTKSVLNQSSLQSPLYCNILLIFFITKSNFEHDPEPTSPTSTLYHWSSGILIFICWGALLLPFLSALYGIWFAMYTVISSFFLIITKFREDSLGIWPWPRRFQWLPGFFSRFSSLMRNLLHIIYL